MSLRAHEWDGLQTRGSLLRHDGIPVMLEFHGGNRFIVRD